MSRAHELVHDRAELGGAFPAKLHFVRRYGPRLEREIDAIAFALQPLSAPIAKILFDSQDVSSFFILPRRRLTAGFLFQPRQTGRFMCCPKTLPNGGVFVPHIYHILRGVVKSNTNHLVERDEGTCVAVEICHGVEVPDRKLKQPDRDASRSEACDARVFRRQTAAAVLVLYLEPIFAAAQPALPLNKNYLSSQLSSVFVLASLLSRSATSCSLPSRSLNRYSLLRFL